MKRFYHLALSFLVVGFFLAPRSFAQDSEKEVRTVIEIRDGKVFLNGKEVAELEDSDAPVILRRNGETVGNAWFSTEGPTRSRNGFMLRRDADGEDHVWSRPRAFGFMSGDDVEVEVLRDLDVERALELSAKARWDAEDMAERMAQFEVSAPSGFAFFGDMGSLSAKGREAEMRSRELAREIRRTDGDTSELEAELDALLAEVFAEKQAAQQERVDELRERLTKLEERLSQREQDREDIIAKRKEQLLGLESRFDW